MTNVRSISSNAARTLARPDALVIASLRPTRSITVATLDGGPAGDDPALFPTAWHLVRELASKHGGAVCVTEGVVRLDLGLGAHLALAVGDVVTGLLIAGWVSVVLFAKPCPACLGTEASTGCATCQGAGAVLAVPPRKGAG